MEKYKQYLYSMIHSKCQSAEDVYDYIKDDKNFTYTMNENGFHSYYTGSYYQPAIIYKGQYLTIMYWLFDGDIKDCIHPFRISLFEGSLECTIYYSSEKIINDQPIKNYYSFNKRSRTFYNLYTENFKYVKNITILDDYASSTDYCPSNDYDESLFTPEFYPLCNKIESYLFKFAD